MITGNRSVLDQLSQTFQSAFTSVRHAFLPKTADCVFIVGPRNKQDVEFLKRQASQHGIRAHFVGDGERPVSKEMIQDARRKGIIGATTEVVCYNHGINFENSDSSLEHRMQLNVERPGEPKGPNRTSTAVVLQWLREPLDEPPEQEGKPWSGNVHFMACQIGNLRKQITSKHDLWKQGHVILHGGSKVVATTSLLDNCAELLRQIAVAKSDGTGRMDPLETMRQLSLGAADTLTLIGGEFKEAVVVRAPKTIPEFIPDYLQARWRQQQTEEKLASSSTQRQESKKKPAIKASETNAANVHESRMVNYMLTRLCHLRSHAKLERLKSDLQDFPAIANLRLPNQRPPLSFVCSYVHYGPQEITATDIARVLLENGAKINDVDMMGASALHHAARRGEKSLIELLAFHGADIHQRDKSGRGVLHWACTAGNKSAAAVRAVLEHCTGMDVNRPDKKGVTPLHLAIMANNISAVDALLEAGADPTKKLWFWQTPSAMAKRLGNDELARKLHEAAEKWRRKPAVRTPG